MAPLKVTAAVCVVLVLMIQLQAPAAAQGISCDECGPGCAQACTAQRPYFCNSFCNIFPTLCNYCFLIQLDLCAPECTNLCRINCV
ncbi:hypothetical protein ACQJBY_036075 [Aegilops geniculata]